ncbi:calcitonin gene-related peptide type 1 receptor-like isoform X1 [Haliotis rufescens]|uniref:calcitonin gene-related peptide type 1 receptor-like isoform X1 n=1 Tax=Haliotis rufescens TaxID=6454 RepID=UPI001EAFBD17|nr:calcitonin gene-related peptide type 1 receptor-like isoform X1 [Haliotis rufescens]
MLQVRGVLSWGLLFACMFTSGEGAVTSCRDRYGVLPLPTFKVWSCTMCFSYLFRDQFELRANLPKPELVAVNGSRYQSGTTFLPDIENNTVVDVICGALNAEDCERWTSCCHAALKCCHRQNRLPPPDPQGQYCPRTWDGFGCFDDTPAGQKTNIKCPAYIEHSNPRINAAKLCTSNATWFQDPGTHQEWTNYTTCVGMDTYMTLFKVGVACNAISIILLVPACIVFIVYRQLRLQQRIKLHLCLFASFILTNVILILWDVLVYKDRLDKPKGQTLMYNNTVGCRLLYTLIRYARTVNFLWMFLEGFHLHRLIVQAFKVPKSLLGYYIGGFVGPMVPVIAYAIVRGVRNDQSCWVRHAGGYEWIIYTPNLLCIVINLFFLASILRILLTQLQSHPNEPSNYRRALKATFILVPLFGLQLFLVIYRPPSEWEGFFYYEVLAKVVSNSQGAVVALIFCFFNGEVHSNLRTLLPRSLRRGGMYKSDVVRSNSMSTQYTTDNRSIYTKNVGSHVDDKGSYIPLTAMNEDQANGRCNGKH